jgi:hypothetical protein
MRVRPLWPDRPTCYLALELRRYRQSTVPKRSCPSKV